METRMLFFLSPFVKLSSRVKSSVKDAIFVIACVSLICLVFLFNLKLVELRYAYYYVIGALLMGIMGFCSLRESLSELKIKPLLFILWMLFGTLVLVSGIINSEDYLPEAVFILLIYPVLFFLWINWGVENAFRLLSRSCVISFCIYALICLIFFPLDDGRYKGLFSSSNGAGQYLSIVFCCLLMNIFDEDRKSIRLTYYVVNYVLFGLCVAFLLYSGARTGMLSAFLGFGVFVIFGFRNSKHIKSFILKLVLLVIVSAVCFSVLPSLSLLNHKISVSYEAAVAAKEASITASSDDAATTAEEVSTASTSDSTAIAAEEAPVASASDNATTVAKEPPKVTTADETMNSVMRRWDLSGKTVKNFSSGRTTVWGYYIPEIDFRGHENSGNFYIPQYKRTYTTSHNLILQMAYNHGIIAGVVFLLLNLCGGISALIYALKHSGLIYSMPLIVIVAFGVASLLESPSISVLYTILQFYCFVHCPLMFQKKDQA